jgi:hypothetical protein
MSNHPGQLGERRFTDGGTRAVFKGADGCQYVEDDGERVYWTWLPLADESLTVPGRHSS